MYCKHCSNPIIAKYAKKFCNSSCSAKYNNLGRVRSKESRAKTATTILEKINN